MIISCGEALIDFLPRRDAAGAPVYLPAAGGSPMNVAVAAARLGAPTAFFGGLSSDMFGDILRSALTASGVDTRLAVTTDRPTTLAFVSLGGGDARYAFYDENTAGRMLSEADLPDLTSGVGALHFGSFSLAVEPCGTALEALMLREASRRLISLDINVRPTLIPDRSAYLARLDRLIAMSDIVKVSAEDLDWLAPGATFADIAAAWLRAGARVVIRTRGADGAEACFAGAHVESPGVAVKVADTIGAGDTFTGAMLARLAETGALSKAAVAALDAAALSSLLAFAISAAAITVSRPGADPPWRRELP